jgi:hypothetical protein
LARSSFFSFFSSSGLKRLVGAGESELRGPDAVCEFEKRPPDPKAELEESSCALENWISTGAGGPDINPEPPPRFSVIGSTGWRDPISISESPPPPEEEFPNPAEGLNETCFDSVGRPEFASIFSPRESFPSSEISITLFKFRSGPGPILLETDSIS